MDHPIQTAGAEQRLQELGITLPAPPEPFGAYVEAVRTGNLLFLSGTLPTEGRQAVFIGSIGAELDMEAGRKAARLAALNALAVARRHLGSLDNVTRVVRLGVSIVPSFKARWVACHRTNSRRRSPTSAASDRSARTPWRRKRSGT